MHDQPDRYGQVTAPPIHAVLDGIIVVDLTTEIAGPYATMLLRDLGARVMKLEPPAGDPLRRWEPVRPDTGEGGLFTYLNRGKERLEVELGDAAIEVLDPLLAGADVLVEDLGAGGLEALGADVEELRRRHPSLVIVRISDHGQTGPHRDVAVTPLVRQASSGWVSSRGESRREPIQVGGRIPEYAGGAYAALAALTGLRQRDHTGFAPTIDLSLMESEVATLSYPMLMHEAAMKRGIARPAGAGAMLGVVRCKDGWIGINALTGQHWHDICAMVELPEFVEHQLPIMFAGPERAQFFAAVQPWLDTRTAEEILDLCQAMRIPAAPVGNGETIPDLAQFAARGFFHRDELGTVTPGCPLRLSRSERQPRTDTVTPPAPEAPLAFSGLRVVDLTTFWAGAYVGCYLGAFGADVIKIESIQRPDGFRFSGAFPSDGDDWYEQSGLFQGGNLNKRGMTLNLTSEEGRALLRRLIADADVVIENFSPRVMEQFGLTPEALLALKPDLVIMRLPGFGLEGPWRNYVGWAYGIEQTSGWAWVTGFADGPPLNPGGPADPIIGVHGAVALLGALEHRRRTGEGQLVEIAQIEVAAAVTAEQVIAFSMTGELQGRDGNRARDIVQGVYPALDTAGEAAWVAISVRHDEDWQGLSALLGDLARPAGVELADHEGRLRRHDLIDEVITSWTETRIATEIVDALRQAGVPAAVVLIPAAMYDEPQLLARGFYCEMDHTVSGRRRYPGWPMRFEPGPPDHHRTPSPTLGQHNDEILGGELGLSPEEIAELRARKVIGEHPL